MAKSLNIHADTIFWMLSKLMEEQSAGLERQETEEKVAQAGKRVYELVADDGQAFELRDMIEEISCSAARDGLQYGFATALQLVGALEEIKAGQRYELRDQLLRAVKEANEITIPDPLCGQDKGM